MLTSKTTHLVSPDDHNSLLELLLELRTALDSGNTREALILAGVLLGSLDLPEPTRTALQA